MTTTSGPSTTAALPTDLEIARAARLRPLEEVVEGTGLTPEHLEPYGRHVAKISTSAAVDLADRPSRHAARRQQKETVPQVTQRADGGWNAARQ